MRSITHAEKKKSLKSFLFHILETLLSQRQNEISYLESKSAQLFLAEWRVDANENAIAILVLNVVVLADDKGEQIG